MHTYGALQYIIRWRSVQRSALLSESTPWMLQR